MNRIVIKAIVLTVLSFPMMAVSQNNTDNGSVLPYPQSPFNGVINKTAKDSKPDFPKAVQPPKGAPNVLLILTDDVGFGASSTFGGPIQTPTFQQEANNGLRYTTFHTTALCSPTRAALITGRNHHSCASGVITEMATGYPGYNSVVPASCGTVAQTLRANGYNTTWFGKMHNIPDYMSSQAGPFDLWPTGLGFDYFFGFVGGDTDQWHTAAFENTVPIELPEQQHVKLTHFDKIMADRAIEWIYMQHSMAPNKPWLLYYATGTAHAPHHAPQEWIAKYKGKFDQGWDKIREETLARQIKLGILPPYTKLTARPKQIPAWDPLTPDQKRLYAHMMEVYAGALSYADYQIGRVIDAVRDSGQLDNTIVIYIMGDNGASAEGTLQGTTNEVATAANGVTETIPYLLSMMNELGGPHTYNHYPVGWAHAMDAPMQWTKQVASHFGGTRNGLVISWPKRITDKGGIRKQFSSVIDITPTLYEAIGITPPKVLYGTEQKPLDGTSMVYTFDKANANVATRHNVQYFELLANRAIYKDGWMASTTPLRLPWVTIGLEPNPEDFPWELYNIDKDPSQANNVVDKYPDKLKELQAAFDVEAKKYNVYPLDSSFASRVDPSIRPSLTAGRTIFTYHQGQLRIPEGSAPNFKNQSWVIDADVTIPKSGAEGVLATIGGNFGGWSLFVMNGKPEFAYAYSNQPQHKYRVISSKALTPGRHAIRLSFKYDGGGIGKPATATMFIDGQQVAQGRIEHTIPARLSLDETFDVGADTGTPVVLDYESKMPFAFTGTLNKFGVLLQPEKLTDEQRKELLKQEAQAFMSVQ
jgi:arylsulfatase A-like enzyme